MKVKVILTRETGGGAILQQSPSPAATVNNNASPTSSLMIKREVLTAALHKFLRQYREKTLRHLDDPDPVGHQDDPVVQPPAVVLQVHGNLEKQKKESLML
jgi:hypothetical protein